MKTAVSESTALRCHSDKHPHEPKCGGNVAHSGSCFQTRPEI